VGSEGGLAEEAAVQLSTVSRGHRAGSVFADASDVEHHEFEAVGLTAREAVVAVAAGGKGHGNVVANRKVAHARADLLDYSGALVPEHHR